MSDHPHPDLRLISRVLPRTTFTRRTIPLMQQVTRLPALAPARGVETVELGPATVRLHRPTVSQHQGAALLWIHGGGYVIGSAAQDDRLCRRFAARLGVPVAAVDYRLAPRHPYPAPLEDCYAALRWLAALPGVDRVAIGGASAGGGLTAALALLARDRGEVAPLFQLLVYPMLDDEAGSRAGAAGPHARLWSEESNRIGWSAYLGGADRDVAVPARRSDLAGLAPAWLGVGTLDSLQGEGERYAARLQEAGVPCELDVVPGVFHGFDAVAPWTGVAKDFLERQCVALERAFA